MREPPIRGSLELTRLWSHFQPNFLFLEKITLKYENLLRFALYGAVHAYCLWRR